MMSRNQDKLAKIIRDYPKARKKIVLAMIQLATLDLLIELRNEGLSGDWRRAAVAYRIVELEKQKED
jgi:hypothetical protein